MNNKIFLSIEFVNNIPTEGKPNKIKDIFGYHHCPSDILGSLDEYYDTFKKKEQNNAKKKVFDGNIIYVTIDYSLTNKAVLKFTSNVPVTYGLLLYAYTMAYQLVYKTEDEDVGTPTGHIPGMLNRAKSNGRFGIWGHDIGDLVYNGNSCISIFDNHVICYFLCDS